MNERDRLAAEVLEAALYEVYQRGMTPKQVAARLIALGWTRECEHCDPRHEWPCPTILRCDEPGCESEATCGWPTRGIGTSPKAGYRRTCGDHMRAAKKYREDTEHE